MRWIRVVAMILAISGVASAQEPPGNPDELNRKYQDALVQLKAAQDRKNELGTENERLTARVAELEKRLTDANRNEATFAEQTFSLRSHYAAWQVFVKQHPGLLESWNIFMERSPLSVPMRLPEYANPTNPLPAE